MKLIYLTTGPSSVFDSQVLALLKYYVEQRWFEEVTLLFGYRNESELNWLEKKNLAGINTILFKTYANYPVFNSKIRKNLSKGLSENLSDFSNTYFHIRGEMLSYHFNKVIPDYKIKISNIVTDIRGASYEEVEEFMEKNILLKRFKLINIKFALKSLKNDNKISVVSLSLKQYLVDKLNLPNHKIAINNCLVSTDFKFDIEKRIEYRKKLMLSKKDVLIIFTSGGEAKWQENDRITEIADKGFKVLNLSKVNIEHKNIINLFVNYNEVPGYLCASDAAFIWRAKSVVNKISSPVKFSEYVSCGLSIIHNGTVDLINNVCDNMSNGILVQSVNELCLKKIEEHIKDINREDLSLKGVMLFGLPKIAESYKALYFS